MSLTFMAYLFTTIPNIKGLALIGAGICVITTFILLIIRGEKSDYNYQKEAYDETTKYIKKTVHLTIVFAILAALIPSRGDLTYMGAAYLGDQVVSSDVTQQALKKSGELGSKAAKVLDKAMSDYLQEGEHNNDDDDDNSSTSPTKDNSNI